MKLRRPLHPVEFVHITGTLRKVIYNSLKINTLYYEEQMVMRVMAVTFVVVLQETHIYKSSTARRRTHVLYFLGTNHSIRD